MKNRSTIALISLLAFALLLRLSTLFYGLPLWLINDEPSTILGSLKMIELKSILPAAHLEEMSSVLYYPPYISYTYLLPFAGVLGFTYLDLGLPFEEFVGVVGNYMSPFFIAARLISITAGLATIVLTYLIALQLTQSKRAGLFAAFFASTSLIHIALSGAARHWIFIALIFSSALYILTKTDWSSPKKYFIYGLVAALGMGVSSISVILFMLPPLWYFYREHHSLNELRMILKDKRNYLGASAVILLSVLPTLIYPLSNGFIVDITADNQKTFGELIMSPFSFLNTVSASEPVLLLFAALGTLILFIRRSRTAFVLAVFVYTYAILFYFMFRFESRFLLPILPVIYVVAGYGTYTLWQRNNVGKFAVLALLLIPFAASLQLGKLALKNDSRVLAVKWAENNIARNDKVITFGSQLRLPLTHEAVSELREIDPGALRKIDVSEERLDEDEIQRFHSLNIYTVTNKSFLDSLSSYVADQGYNYLIKENAASELHGHVRRLVTEDSRPVITFGKENTLFSLATSDFKGSVFELFKTKQLGPEITIYEL